MANRTDRRHHLTDDDRRRGQAKRSDEERRESARKGWEKRRANGGGLTREQHVAGGRASGAIAKQRGHEYFVELGRKSVAARRKRREVDAAALHAEGAAS